ncbi:aminopeptidase Y [Microdochium trichocladiopsis]|uniref:Peptide hydrolase n=1 Tax=Microdochium trichocladiopsis TaxID=1682393 RepID=A0A9P8Y6I8_9PEZI|nr:aminopeptidase Y [Microdochium trichocladiopsis]KAH7030608.1 aminopeptidase Y [Microdochium trichocladiopsis]
MKSLSTVALLASRAAASSSCKPYVDSEKLQSLINLDDLLAGSQKLQDFADANGGNRAFGGGGHNATVDWLYDTLQATGYFDVVKQPFVELFSAGSATLTVAGEEFTPGVMTYSPATDGTVSAPIVAVSNLGCNVADYPSTVSGSIALILRGTCSFAIKAANAKTAGAVGAIVYNNIEGAVAGTLGGAGDYAPVVGIPQSEGNAILAALETGEVTGDLFVTSILENRTNFNVIAETKQGDKDNVLVLGGHSDSVFAGPGINDDGSGTIGVWAVAKALTHFKIKNAVRFAFWGAEEFGKLGSFYYVKQLNQTEDEIAKIRAYLNFDMIASPNYVLGVYDGDGGAFNFSGPAGSAQIEKDFEEFYTANGQAFVPSVFSGRSDYAGFIENGIPSGGLFTGAENIKTAEEAALFGGEAGVAYDVNYHKAGDTIDNLNTDAFLLNTKSIANSVAKYAISWDSLPPVDLAKRRWSADHHRALNSARSTHGHDHAHAGPCGQGKDLI